MADTTVNTKIYVQQDGDTQVIENGGSLELGANVTLTISGTNVIITGLPTSDPAVSGALYTNANVLTLSA